MYIECITYIDAYQLYIECIIYIECISNVYRMYNIYISNICMFLIIIDSFIRSLIRHYNLFIHSFIHFCNSVYDIIQYIRMQKNNRFELVKVLAENLNTDHKETQELIDDVNKLRARNLNPNVTNLLVIACSKWKVAMTKKLLCFMLFSE